MIVLHIAKIQTNLDNGVNAVVPKHVIEQGKFADTALLNVNNVRIDGVLQLKYTGAKSFPGSLDKPFDKPDLVVFHEVNVIEFIALYKKLKKAGIPYIIVPHGEITEQALKKKWLKKKIAYFLWFNRFIKNAKAVQCLSNGEFDKSKIKCNKFISSNGTNIPQESKQYQGEAGMKLLYIGRLDWVHKGLDMMINAIGSIQDYARANEITLDIYGPDFYGRREKIESIIKKNNVDDIVKVHNPIFGDEKKKIILNHDVFIQTSRFEGQPLGILEAMSFGMAVIATNGTNFVENICACNGGYDAGSSESEIADAICKAFETKKQWPILGENAKEFIRQRYNWESMAKIALVQYGRYVE